MLDPYDGIDWNDCYHVHSVCHEHTFAPNTGGDTWDGGESGWAPQGVFDSLYDRGIRHFAISNYHPSKPTYPLEEFFEDVPSDALGCPNAEHSAERGHYCGIGSTFSSESAEFGETWRPLFDGILANLVYDAGGGIVINHPRRSRLSFGTVCERLDYDDRVIGIEAWNHRGVVAPKYRTRGNAVSTWDELLSTGREVFGFFNPDYHERWDVERWGYLARGRNVLVLHERTEQAAARAYRQGRFYGALDGTGLRFDRIDATEDAIEVEVNGECCIEFITAGQAVHREHGRKARYSLAGNETYVRIEAHDETGERIFSQPILTEPEND